MKRNDLLFENTSARLTEVGLKRKNNGDISGAVSAFRSAIELRPFDHTANASLAETYTEIEMFTDALNCWFRALSSAESNAEKARAYNGLAANYYFLNKDMLAIHYFNEQLSLDMDGEYAYNDIIEEVQEAEFEKQNELGDRLDYFVIFDRNADDDSKVKLNAARALTEEGKLNEALILLSQVPETSSCFVNALEAICFVLLLKNDFEKAEEVADRILSLDRDNFRAQYVLCSCYKNLGRAEESEVLYGKMVASYGGEEDRNLHFVMLSLDTEHDSEALSFIEKELEQNPYNMNMLYLRALVKYNLKDVSGCVEDMKRVLIFTDNPIITERLATVRGEKGTPPERLKYDFDLENEEIEFRLDDITRRFREKQLDSVTLDDIKEQCKCAIKCRLSEMFPIALHLGLNTDARKMHEFVQMLLMDVSVPDDFKRIILKEYLLLGINMPIMCVTGNIFNKFTLMPLNFSDHAADVFGEAYALAAANIYILDHRKITLLRRRIKKMYLAYCENIGPEDAPPNVLAACIIRLLNLHIISDVNLLKELFGTSENEMEDIVKYLKS